jgi:hypothetical protein
MAKTLSIPVRPPMSCGCSAPVLLRQSFGYQSGVRIMRHWEMCSRCGMTRWHESEHCSLSDLPEPTEDEVPPTLKTGDEPEGDTK